MIHLFQQEIATTFKGTTQKKERFNFLPFEYLDVDLLVACYTFFTGKFRTLESRYVSTISLAMFSEDIP
jgi:hypothetical protein